MKFGSTDISQHYVGSSLVPRIYNCEDTNYVLNETAFDADVLIIGGGGGGGGGQGGGGGGGGYREFTKKYYTGTSYTVTVGAGGSVNSNGSDSSIEKIGTGGGAGGNANGATQEACNGKDGGSGGGGGLTSNTDFRNTSGGNSISPRCNGSSQGYPGDAGPYPLCSSGGAGGTGTDTDGGPGKTSTITGTSVGRAGGGAPLWFGDSSATDGGGLKGQNGTANTGGGGGGNANGGSGFVCIKFPDTITITIGGGLTYTSSTSGGYTTVQFTAGTDTIEFFWNPKTYGGLELWLDSNDSETITLNGGTVSQWDDKSGNDYHVSQGTASNQPTLTSNVLNSRNVLRFDGGDYLTNASATPVGGSTNRTIFLVFNYTGSDIRYAFYLGPNGGSSGQVFGITQEIAVRVSFGNRIWSSSVGSSHSIVSIVLDGTSTADISAWQNGTSLGVSSTLSNTINTQSSFGVGGQGTSMLIGDVAEVLVYSSALSTAQREQVESYLSNKWGIT